jgi:hypothetical protein
VTDIFTMDMDQSRAYILGSPGYGAIVFEIIPTWYQELHYHEKIDIHLP